MAFTTDKQTLDDLNVFGKRGEEGIFQLFNRCATRGGAAMLEEMFRYPLSDEKAINERSGIIKRLAAAGAGFPFSIAYFDAVETYLSNTDERTRLHTENVSLSRRLSDMVAKDTETIQIRKGIQAGVSLLRECHDFVISSCLTLESRNQPETAGISSVLADPSLLQVLDCPDEVPTASFVLFDAILRFRHRDLMLQLLNHLYKLDVYVSVAKVAAERKFCFPKAISKGQPGVMLEGVYHPLVKQAVSNTLHITPSGNVIFLTGANMAGKSTLMKAVSIALLLAHMGMPVPAAAMEFAVLDGLYTTINLPDNLGLGASHFYAEVLRVKQMARELAAGKKLFIVFDELFRGTNVKDAYEATIGVTRGFACRKDSAFIISTHIIEAAGVLEAQCGNIQFLYLPTRMNGHLPVYTYQIEQGVTDDRHGMVIIQNEGILDILKYGKNKFKIKR
ncbi:adenylyl-sulfate kinase [Flavitalea sp. BT771]|uniref:MutS-related protein n=1 Tax=Flavitalea sp. BT771 TaxID=3063329 RepID=UPI0026E2B467|nr:adenylyl-sulfate kinase [Flavitalea sp. BT771]MDO6431682.1 adenylyl-sulfate kinase [Flavitalea sp. BT771]MDV6220590.1 adenylyl-sulfate kinase [Flavitalea sp. BT771]